MSTAKENLRRDGTKNRAILYGAFADADPAERGEMLLRLVEEHTPGRLELYTHEGQRATLDGIDLSRERLAREQNCGKTPSWWNVERQAVGLRKSDLRGASLRNAHLHGALLEETDLSGADLAGAILRGADLSGATLQGALLEGADLRDAVLRFLRAPGSILEDAKLQSADLWGADMEGADLSGADLRGAILEEANLQRADLADVDFRGADLKRADLRGANLTGADLRGASLGGAKLDEAILRGAIFEELDLTTCSLTHVHTCDVRLEKTRIERDQLGDSIGEEVNREYGLARKGYLALERNFEELGDHEAASWAYRRRRRMEKQDALQKARSAWRQRCWGPAIHLGLKCAGDQVVELVCDYGESVWRVIGTLIIVFILFIPLYGLSETMLRVEDAPTGRIKSPTRELPDLALCSLTAMTSPGSFPEHLLPRNELAYLLAGAQTVLSIFLTGLMGFVAGNRIRR